MRSILSIVLLLALILMAPVSIFAADVVTDGDMEAAGAGSWPHTNVTGSNSSAKATDQSASGQSLKGTSQTGDRQVREWYNAQSVGSIDQSATVNLSFWYGYQHHVNTQGGATIQFWFDIKPTAGSTWTNIWTSGDLGNSTSFRSNTANQDVSGSFTVTQEYDIRLRVTGKTGRTNAYFTSWWDNVVLDVSASNVPPTATVGNPADGSNIGGPGPYTIDGTANDTDGTVSSVRLQIQRGAEYWNDSTQDWTLTPTWIPDTALTNGGGWATWSYSWFWTTDMEGTSVSVTAEATDDLSATGTDTNNTNVDTLAPRVSNGVRFQPLPTSDDVSFTLLSDWTEANAGTPQFRYESTIGNTAFENGSAGNSSSKTYGVALTGSHEFTLIQSQHTDSYANGPTLSEDTATVYVLPLTPPAPSVANNGTENSLDVTINANPSEDGTGMLYAIECLDDVPAHIGYVQQGTGLCDVTEDWQTLAIWGSPVVVGGLSAGTTYQFKVAAGNPRDGSPTTGERSASAYGSAASATTTAGNSSPTVTVGNPGNGGNIGGPGPYTIDGTANDTDGTVTQVLLTIQRQDDSRYWNGSGWQVGSTTVAANSVSGDYDTWDYSWAWTSDMEGTSVSVTAEATDDLSATGSDTNTTTVDTLAPRISNGVRFQTLPTSGDASFTLLSDWTEANTGTPQFRYESTLGSTAFENGSAGNSSSKTYSVAVTGSDEFTLIQSQYADSYANGPTLSQDSGPFYVLPLTPIAPTVANNGTGDSLDVTINANPSEGGTGMLYAIECLNAGGGHIGYVQQGTGLCDVTEDWQTLVSWGGPVVVGGLSAGTTYQFKVAAGNPRDGSPTTGERSASAYGNAASAATSSNAVTVGVPSAVIDDCNQITVSAPFAADDNNNSSTLFEHSPNGTDSWSSVCANVTGASPRQCVDAVPDNSVNYYRVTFSDTDGISGTNPSAPIGPYDTTPSCTEAGTTIGSVTAGESSCTLITVVARFSGDGDTDGSTKFDYKLTSSGTWTAACTVVTGASPRQCLIPELTPGASYDLRVTFTDSGGVTPDGNLDANNEEVVPTGSPLTLSACNGSDDTAPTLLVLVPARNAVLGATDRVKIQVYDPGLAAVDWSVDSDNDLDLVAATLNSNYICGTNCNVYEFDLVTTALSQGSHYFTIRATDTQGNVARLTQGFQVNNLGSKAAGDGYLLRRTRGSQLCIDCHNLATHSSQTTSADYGNWAIGCTVCHTPHRTTNISLIRQQIETPKSGVRSVRFENTTGAVADSSTPGDASYVNEDHASQTDGPCQVCHTRTKSSGGAARWQNADAGGNVDTHYTSSSTSTCTGCHSHAAGFSGAGGACDSCHFAPPSVGNHGSHDQVGTLPDDYANLTPTTTAGLYGFACAKCHGSNPDNHFPGEAAPYTVDIAFDATADPQNPIGSYTPDGPSQATDPGKNGDGWYWSDGTCGSLYCHSNAAPIGGGTNTYATVTWDQSAVLDCASCHDTQGRTDSSQAADLSTAHGKHIQSTSGETGTYSFKCDECHAATIVDAPNDPWNLAAADLTDKREHVDGVKDVVISTAYDGTGPGGDNYSSFTCSDTYCHSQGTTTTGPFTGASAPNTALSWETDSSTCISCHDWDATQAPTDTMSTGKHENHVDNLTSESGVLGVNLECAICHDATVSSGDNGTITNFANHVNKAKNVSGANIDTWTNPTCAGYCHSSGQAPSPPSSTSYEEYAPNWSTGPALDCKGCHGRHSEAAFTSTAGEPNYTNDGAGQPDANSHAKHVSAATDCTSCHNTTTTTGTEIIDGATIHTDGTRDVVIAAAYDTGDPNYTQGTKTCQNVSCHGAGSPQWGGTVYCINCHGDTDDNDSWDIDDTDVSTISTSEWSNWGHGQSGTGAEDDFPLPGANPCLYCHDDGVNHNNDLNPFRLANFGATSVDTPNDGWNSVCLVCHMTGSSGYNPGSGVKNAATKINAYHAGTDHTASNDGGTRCWDCHDPHGDDTNYKMIGDFLLKDGADEYGLTGTRTTITRFQNNPATWTDFAAIDPGPYDKVCNVCHDDGGDGCETGNHYTSTCGDGHKSGQLCTGCHVHDQPPNEAFKPVGGGDCLSCHGDASGAPGRRAVGADFNKNSHHVGASQDATGATLHTQPNMGGALTNFDCVVCHAEGKVIAGPDTDDTGQPHQDGVIDLRNTDHATDYWSYDKDSITGAPGTWMSGNSTWETETSTALDPFCLSCHDVDGASATFNDNEGLSFTGTAKNPFADSAITNEYDWVDRTDVVNIRNKVDAYVDDSNTTITPVDRELGIEPRTTDGRPDPTKGIYSRHAIRGDGTFGSGSVYGSNQIPSNRWVTRPTGSWNDQSVMGCADCHTTDGANTTFGNAHGSNTEYLLKDADGLATTEPTFVIGSATSSKINCYKCHTAGWYARETGQEHTDNNSDWVFTADGEGTSGRVTSDGNVYGLPCTNCHGGAASFGTIHGTSEIFDANTGWKCSDSGDWCDPADTRACSRNPGFCTVQVERHAYRFMNGASLRYYDPNGWTGSSVTCYTLGSDDSWGGCTQHDQGGSGKPWTRPVTRPIKY